MIFQSLTIHDTKLHIAELTKALRGYDGISQYELAETLDMSRITIQNLEGAKNINIDTFLKVLQHFDLLEKFDAFLVENIEDKNIKSLY